MVKNQFQLENGCLEFMFELVHDDGRQMLRLTSQRKQWEGCNGLKID